jgi:hypothetical protein
MDSLFTINYGNNNLVHRERYITNNNIIHKESRGKVSNKMYFIKEYFAVAIISKYKNMYEYENPI